MTAEGGSRRYYVDTSAWLAALLRQPGGAEIAAEVKDAEVVSSVLLVVEIHRNLIRLGRERKLKPREVLAAQERFAADLATIELADLTLDLALDRAMPALATPRSLDLIHLRTALRFHAEQPLTRFVTLDAAQSEAAHDLGLPV